MSEWLLLSALSLLGILAVAGLLYWRGWLQLGALPKASPNLSLADYGRRIQRSRLAISVTDMEGRFVLINDRKVRYLGLERQSDAIGRFPWDFAPQQQPSEAPSFVEGMGHINIAATGEQPRFEWELNDRAGNRFAIEVTLTPIELAEGTYVAAVARQL